MMIKSQAKILLFTGLLLVLFSIGTNAQKPKTAEQKEDPKPAATKPPTDKQLIDSLQLILARQLEITDSITALHSAEKLATADLRNQLIQLDDYRKKLEDNISSFRGENLKLNQSNRILIVFNSLVAILLITSLIFFLRKIGRKKNPSTEVVPQGSLKKVEPVKFTNFEDKLQQLERLGKLKEKSLLSEEEFIVEKQRILGK